MRARIFVRTTASRQSSHMGSQDWVLEHQPLRRETNDPLMGWWGNGDPLGMVRLRFDSKEDAVAYAEKHGLTYDIEEPPAPRAIKPKAYADNFRWGRAENWTH